MFWSKIQCAQCEHYRSCPSKTRLYINYCGSRREKLSKDIEAAVADCKARRSFIVKYRRPSRFKLPGTPFPSPAGNS